VSLPDYQTLMRPLLETLPCPVCGRLVVVALAMVATGAHTIGPQRIVLNPAETRYIQVGPTVELLVVAASTFSRHRHQVLAGEPGDASSAAGE
jgi:hypothetical protein